MTTDECAARTVAFPHCALDMRRNAARASADLAFRLSWARCTCQAPLLCLHQEMRDRAIDDDIEIAIGHGVAQEIAKSPKPIVPLSRECDVQAIAFARHNGRHAIRGIAVPTHNRGLPTRHRFRIRRLDVMPWRIRSGNSGSWEHRH